MRLSRTLQARHALMQTVSTAVSMSSPPIRHHLMRYHLLKTSCRRWNTSLTSSSVATSSCTLESDTAKTESDPVDSVKIDLDTVGAEDATVLTIADVLNAREKDEGRMTTSKKKSVEFEGWESIADTDTVHDAVLTMTQRNIGSLIVTEAKEGIVGIVTERDIIKKLSPRTILNEEKAVREIMSSHIMCIHPSTTVIDALATMTKENIRHLAVVNGDMTSAVKRGSVQQEDMRCVLSITDIVRAYAECEASKSMVMTLQDGMTAKNETTKPKQAKTTETTTRTTESTTETDTREPSADGFATASTTLATPVAPVVTAATLLKKKHKRVKLILNTRPEDNVTVAEAVEEMARRDFGAVLVVDKEQRVLGIFTERDYIRKVLFKLKGPAKLLVTDVMSPVASVLQVEDSLEKCWNLAATSTCRHFPVVGVRQDREKELAGILSIKDIVREISKHHHATPGFRLMEFLKSKMESKRVEPKSEQHASPELKQPEVEAATKSKSEVSSASTGSQDPELAASKEAEAPRLVSSDETELKK